MTRVLRGITWDHDRGIGGLRATADASATERPDVRVEWTARSLQAFADEPVDRLAQRFDLLMIDHPSIGHAAGSGAFVPLDEHLDPAFLEDQSANSVGSSHDSYAWDGHQWALAVDAAAQVAAYRPDLLDRAGVGVPRSWGDVFSLAGVGVAFPSIPVDAICAFLGLAGGVEFARDAGAETLDLLARLVSVADPDSRSLNPPRTLERMASTDEIAYVPLAFGYSNYARAGYRDHVVLAAPPPGRATLGGAGLAVSSRTEHAEEAVAYAAFTASGEVQRTVYLQGGGQPGHRAAWTDDDANRLTAGFFEATLPAVDAAYLRPRHAGFIDYQNRAGDVVHRFLADGGDIDGTLDELERAWETVNILDRQGG